MSNINQKEISDKNDKYMLVRILAAVFITLLVIFDQWTKILAVEHLMGNKPIVILDGIFELTYVENRGAAFGMLSGGVDFFVIVTCILVPVMIYLITKIDNIVLKYNEGVNRKAYSALKVVIVFLIAGALGNFVDRIVNGFVVDFFYFKLIDFPVFNVADIYVTLATLALLFILFFVLKERELDYLIYPKKKWDKITEKTYKDDKKLENTDEE